VHVHPGPRHLAAEPAAGLTENGKRPAALPAAGRFRPSTIPLFSEKEARVFILQKHRV
jgi:hypothetical protein